MLRDCPFIAQDTIEFCFTVSALSWMFLVLKWLGMKIETNKSILSVMFADFGPIWAQRDIILTDLFWSWFLRSLSPEINLRSRRILILCFQGETTETSEITFVIHLSYWIVNRMCFSKCTAMHLNDSVALVRQCWCG